MTKQKLGAFLVIVLLIASNVFLAISLSKAQKEVSQSQAQIESINAKEPYIKVNKLFIEKLLKAEGEINYDTRFELENAVRDLGDAEVRNEWDKFVNAKDEKEAQMEVKNFLGLLAERMGR